MAKRKFDPKHLKIVVGKGYEGVVYTYTLHSPNDKKDGWKYVGCTPEEELRKKKWAQVKNPYAGRKIANARKKYGLACFDYAVLETLYAPDIDTLVSLLEQRETYYIKKFDSFRKGFNGNKGGTGRKGIKQSKREIAKRTQTRKRNGFHHTEESKKKIAAASSKRKKSDEERAKISAHNKGKKRTPEMRASESKRMKGKTPLAATEGAKRWVKENGGGYWKNHPLSDNARENMKAAQQERGTKTRVHYSDGTTQDFNTMLDAANACGILVGSVTHSIKHHSAVKKNGAWFEKIA